MQLQTENINLLSYLNEGGFVMWPLVIGNFIIWYALGCRFYLLRRGTRLPVRELVKSYLKDEHKKSKGLLAAAVKESVEMTKHIKGDRHSVLEECLMPFYQITSKYSTLSRSIVICAPLAGLLGTVAGMIEMFSSLAGQEFYSQSGGIAGGISEALFTTQLGLAVAVPGLIVGRLLDKTEENIKLEFEQIKALLTGNTNEV